jgi:hypothetical protein
LWLKLVTLWRKSVKVESLGSGGGFWRELKAVTMNILRNVEIENVNLFKETFNAYKSMRRNASTRNSFP